MPLYKWTFGEWMVWGARQRGVDETSSSPSHKLWFDPNQAAQRSAHRSSVESLGACLASDTAAGFQQFAFCFFFFVCEFLDEIRDGLTADGGQESGVF